MLLNYFKIAWRSLIKDKKYSVINFIGLGIGIASAILIFLFVQHEQSFDRFHEDANKIHRMWVKEFVEGDVFFNTITPLIMGNEARDNFAEVTHMSHFISGSQLIRVGSDVQEENVSFADPDFFEIFDFSLGEGTHSLSDPGEVIITSELANKYFNNRQAIDNTISIFSNNEWRDFRVAGIVEEIPSNSSIRFDILLPYDLYRQGVSEGGQACWTCVFGETYVMLQEGTTGKHMQERSASFFDEKVKDQYEPGKYVVGFQPLTDIHLNNDFPTGIAPVSDARYPYILSGIALLILLLAGINYVSLAIGRTLSRSKEVGIRKVAGAGRRQIMTQYWSEAILTTAIAAILALILTSAALPFFNQLFDLNIVIPYGVDLFLILIASSIVLGVMAAIYPSILLSGFNPIQAITGKLGKRATSKHQILRALVGIQFFMSIVLVVSTLIMKRQIDFMRDKDLGYDKNATLVVSRTDGGSLVEMLEESEKLTRIFQNEIASSANVRSVTASNHALGSIGWMRLGYMEEGTGVFRNFQMNGIDDQFLSSYGIELLSGRNFHGNKELDVNAVLVNEQFLEEFNIDAPESAFLPKPFESFKIVGVVEDFHFASLHESIGPLPIGSNPMGLLQITPDLVFNESPAPNYSFKLSANKLQQGVQEIRGLWDQHVPDQPFDFTFTEDDLNAMYLSEIRLSRMVVAGAGLAILIACLGLYGITGISMNRRQKEIGIRKVLGASLFNLLGLFSRDFLKLILVAFVLAVPISWWVMGEWLRDFAYSVSITAWVFIIAAVFSVLVALFSIGVQTLFYGLRNPIDTLRTE